MVPGSEGATAVLGLLANGVARAVYQGYDNSMAVQQLSRVASIVFRRSTELRNRAGAKEEQIRM